MYGFHGRLLQIDLTSGQSSWRELEESRLRAFLGGIGLGTSLLYDYAPAGSRSFFSRQPADLYQRPAGRHRPHDDGQVWRRHQITAHRLYRRLALLQPFRSGTEAHSESTPSSSPARPLRLVYLFISDDKVEIREAEHLRGKSPSETEAAIKPS